ncbi:MAG: class I SAM-dependent methyltransferase [Bacteroidia bacterium]|nr:class I SAM-dependent methyltransferase [Bacteroidia bacterium]
MKTDNTDLTRYYKLRANEYDQIYLKPERQDALAAAKLILKETFKNKHLLEVACGTGYWTEAMSQTAASVVGIDINQEVLEIAARKNYAGVLPNFIAADIYHYAPTQLHNALFGGFIWSHIKLEETERFITTLLKMVEKNSVIVLMDNVYVEGSNLPITQSDENGNTYQTRKLSDGTTHQVLKNFPSESFLRNVFKEKLESINYIQLDYYWLLTGTVKGTED